MPQYIDELWSAACVLAGSSVGLGAFGAHGLHRMLQANPANLESRLHSWRVATGVQMTTALGVLVATAVSAKLDPESRSATRLQIGSGLLIAGTTLFSGSIYLLVMNPARFRVMGPVTPLGGIALMLGWAALASAAPRS